ncbi:MAG: asparagine synthase-related protein [Xanthobacteraceae bacterium]
MSGIAGLMRLRGPAVARRDLERMANALRPHGPDRSAVLVADSIGLAHALMRMTPEDQFDRQPLQGQSGAMIAADLRLDNREDMLAEIGVAARDAMAWPDAQIVLTAWEKFGDAVWPRLRGPFAAAIWDPRSRVLTLARDHLGLNVVMWHRSEQFFAFASMPKGLFALPDVPRELSEEKFADFLVLNHADHASTLYRHIFRLPPAHVAKVAANGSMVQHRYWSTADVKPVRLGSDQAYADGLRECLDRAVRRQMRSAHPIGSHLSGGLDCSSVSVLAARALAEKGERLTAYTQVPRAGFDGPVADGCYADETPYVEAIRQLAGNIDVTYILNDECDDFADLERCFLALEGPVRNPLTLGWMLAIPRAARGQGRRVLLGGLFGNSTISWSGWSQTIDHLLAGRLITALLQWRLYYRCSPDSRWSAFHRLILEPLLAARWPRSTAPRHRTAPWSNHSAIRADFAAAKGVEERARTNGHDFLYRERPGERAKGLMPVDYMGDWLAAEKAITGVELRDPTADIDVVSLCFGVPPEQYLVEDIDRSLIRRAMWGLLPDVVLTNRQSGVHSADWYEKLNRRRDWLAGQLAELSASPLARRAIDFPRLERAIKNWSAGGLHTSQVADHQIADEYQLALPRAFVAARFSNWFESTNR